MSNFFKKLFFWIILISLMLGAVLFINSKVDQKKSENSESKPNQKTPQLPNNDKPKENPETIPPIDTENWWLTDEEIEYAYQELGKEIANSPEIQLVSPSAVRVIQAGGEISEDLKKAKYIFFPISNSETYEAADAGSHWTLLLYFQKESDFYPYDPLKDFNKLFVRKQTNEKKLAEKFREKLGETSWTLIEDPDNPKQTNDYDCGVFVIAFTRALVKKIREKGEEIYGLRDIELREKDLIFTIAEERQKLKAAGFPKKGTLSKDYEIVDDIEYLEKEEEFISQWWPKPDNPFHSLRKCVRANWNLDIESEASQLYDHADNFKNFSEKIRLLSGKITKKNTEKKKLQTVYNLKKILKYCSLSVEELKKTKSFNNKENFRDDKITGEERKFVRDNLNPEKVKEINDLYEIHFPK